MPLEADRPQPPQAHQQSRGNLGGQSTWGGLQGRGPDLNDSDAHTHAEDDAQVVLQPCLHLRHTTLKGENMAMSTHVMPSYPVMQNQQEWLPPAQRACSVLLLLDWVS